MRRSAERLPCQTGTPAQDWAPHASVSSRGSTRVRLHLSANPTGVPLSTGSRSSSGRGVCRPNSNAAHRLRERISAAGDCESILAIVAQRGRRIARNAATACHRLAKLSRGSRNGPRMADPRVGLLLGRNGSLGGETRRTWRTRFWGAGDARMAGGGGADARCAGGGSGARRTEHERAGGGEHRSGDWRRSGGRRGGADARCAGGGSGARRTEHERAGCGEHDLGAGDARVAGGEGAMRGALEGGSGAASHRA
jgi:hypothetical protein